MPAYAYEALDNQGQSRQGVIDADSPKTARAQLRAQGWIALHVKPVQSRPNGLETVIWEAKVFSLSALAMSGMPPAAPPTSFLATISRMELRSRSSSVMLPNGFVKPSLILSMKVN